MQNAKDEKRRRNNSSIYIKLKELWIKISGYTKNIVSKTLIKLSDAAVKAGADEETLKEYSMLAVILLFGYFMGIATLPQQIRPFGIAAMCAFSDKKKALCTYVGVALACLSYGSSALSSFIIYFMLYAVRKVFTESEFSESMSIRIAESAAISAATGIIRISTAFEAPVYSVVALFSLMGVSCAFTYFFTVIFSRTVTKKIGLSTLSICTYALMAAIICSFDGITLFGFDIQLAAACVITLTFAATNGFLHAGIVGFVCGMFCAVPSVSASLGICGIVAALAVSKSIFAALFSFASVFFICASYSYGLSAGFMLSPSVLCGCILFFPACSLMAEPFRITVKASGSKETFGSNKESKSHRKLSDAFFSLSDIFSKLADKQKHPAYTDTELITDKAFSAVCAECALNEMCFARKNTDIEQLKETLFSVLASRSATPDDFGKQMNDKCIRLDRICETVNTLYRELTVNLSEDNRTSLLCAQYAGMARLISDTDIRRLEEEARDPAFEKSIAAALTEAEIPFSSVCVKSGREKKTVITGIAPDKIPFGANELKKYIFSKCGLKITEPSFDISEKNLMIMSFERAPVISVEYSKASLAKKGSSINGDSVCFINRDANRFNACICDGMASGREAAAASRLSVLFLEQMLNADVSKGIVLELLNNALMSRSGEYFSTADIFEADLLTGKSCFVKAGAAPTYILRGNKLYKICSETPPVGIIPGFTAESTAFDIEPGDTIIMMSDGVIQNGEDSRWLAELIRVDTEKDPASLAKTIIEKSSENGVRSDDMSVAVIKISAHAA